MIIGGITDGGTDLNEAFDLITGQTCTLVTEYTDGPTEQQTAFGDYLERRGPTICYESVACRYYDVLTRTWTVAGTTFEEDSGAGTKAVIDEGELLVILNADEEWDLAIPSTLGGIGDLFLSSFGPNQAGVGLFASMTADGDTIILTGGSGTENVIEFWTISLSGLKKSTYNQQLNVNRLAHCSTIFTHPTHGSVVAVIGGAIEGDDVSVEYISLDDPNEAPIIDSSASDSAPAKTFLMTCVKSPTDDGFYMLGGQQDAGV